MAEAQDRTLPVKPQPGFLKTIGVLNLLLGGFLSLCGAGCLSQTVPFLKENAPFQLDPTQTEQVVADMRLQIVEDLRRAEARATSPAERARLSKTRTDLETRPGSLAGKVDFEKINQGLPWVSRYLWADLLSGPVLNLAMIVAGVGLLLLKNWGRRLALVVAALKLTRLVLLTALLMGFVLPSLMFALQQFAGTEIGEALVTQAAEQQKAQGAGGAMPKISAADFVQVLQALGYGSALMNLGVGAIYPAICLIVLTRAGARLAVAGPGTPKDEAAGPSIPTV